METVLLRVLSPLVALPLFLAKPQAGVQRASSLLASLSSSAAARSEIWSN